MPRLIDPASRQDEKAGSAQEGVGTAMDVEKTNPKARTDDEANGNDPETPGDAQLEKWNASRSNIFRFGVTLFGFIIMGMNDAVLGVSDDLPRNESSSKRTH